MKWTPIYLGVIVGVLLAIMANCTGCAGDSSYVYEPPPYEEPEEPEIPDIDDIDDGAWNFPKKTLVLCIHDIVFEWNPSGEQDVKAIGLEGVVVKVGQDGTIIRVDFKHGHKKHNVMKHPLNHRKVWKHIKDCGIIEYELWR